MKQSAKGRAEQLYISTTTGADLAWTYRIAREAAPNAFLIANVGALQLIDQKDSLAYNIEKIQKLVEVIKADALAIHFARRDLLYQAELSMLDTAVCDE